MPSIIDRVLKISDNRVLKRMQATVDAVNLLEDDFRALSDAELRAETDALRARHADGESLDRLLPEAFAAVREEHAGYLFEWVRGLKRRTTISHQEIDWRGQRFRYGEPETEKVVQIGVW